MGLRLSVCARADGGLGGAAVGLLQAQGLAVVVESDPGSEPLRCARLIGIMLAASMLRT